MTATSSWWRALWPAPLAIDRRERWRVTIGAALGLLATGWLCQFAAGSAPAGWPWLVAPMGATAVLLFVVPASPMASTCASRRTLRSVSNAARPPAAAT